MPRPTFSPDETWTNVSSLSPVSYVCGYCSVRMSTSHGFLTNNQQPHIIRICSNCKGPTFFSLDGTRYPGDVVGGSVAGIPEKLGALYDEARSAASAGAHTASVMICRKMLMNVAVEQGAEADKSFASYVDFLAAEGWVPPNGKQWLAFIKTRGNVANHQIELMNQTDSSCLIRFVEMLLKFIYEMPLLLQGASETNTASAT